MSPELSQAPVVVDWSRVSSVINPQNSTVDAEALVSWVRRSPLRSRIHVYLKPSVKERGGRSLQSTLQSLGCIVTMRGPMRSFQ